MPEGLTLIRDGNTEWLEARVAGGRVFLAPEVLRASLGWQLEPEGLCRGDVCVPVRDRASLLSDDGIDLTAFAKAVGLPLALDVEERTAALGTSAVDQAARLQSLEAPDFSLPDLEGKLHSLSDHRGKKVLLVVYASW